MNISHSVVVSEQNLQNTVSGWLVGFYGISDIVSYLMPNPLYTYILDI